MTQNNILATLKKHPIIPVVTIHTIDEIDAIIQTLMDKNIFCIEVTLRTKVSLEALAYIKANFKEKIAVGVGTIISLDQIQKVKEIGVDFIVSPGINANLAKALEETKLPFIPGVSTPSEIMQGIQMGWNVFKFFPANLFGGTAAIKTYGQVFPDITFCPTGGINETTFSDYLNLQNVVSVGGSWMMK